MAEFVVVRRKNLEISKVTLPESCMQRWKNKTDE
jgi:hypothetical protein